MFASPWNSYFLHWNFDKKSCFVVFFHEWKKSTIQFNFSLCDKVFLNSNLNYLPLNLQCSCMFRIVKKVILKCQILSFWPLHPWAVSNYWSGYQESDTNCEKTRLKILKSTWFSTYYLSSKTLWSCKSNLFDKSLTTYFAYLSQPSPYSYFISYEYILHNNTFLDP